MSAKNVAQLKREYSDKSWQQKFLDFFDLMEILGDCFISDNYVIPDELNTALKLSSAGADLQGMLVRKENVPVKEARLMCALTIGHEELHVDIEKLDIEGLARLIGEQLISGAIRFPYVHGREFYDAYAVNHEEGKEYLNSEDTMNLLGVLPIGVFQYGKFVTGPFGLQTSLDSRSVQSTRRVPAFHCERQTCRVVHSIGLQTGDAPINKDREKVVRTLEAKGEPSKWVEFADELRGMKDAFFSDSRAGVLLPLLGEAFSDAELRLLAADLMDSTGGALRARVSEFTVVHDANSFVDPLDRGSLLQILLIARERDLGQSVDRLVRAGQIQVPNGEIRRAVIGKQRATGAFQLRAEIGAYGVRFASSNPGYPLLRLKSLLENLYSVDGPQGIAERGELEWQLRHVRAEGLTEQLEMFYRSHSPVVALKRLVLARQSNVVQACEEVGIEEYNELSDDDLVKMLLWKLGFRIQDAGDIHQSFWERHQRLWALVQSSEMGQSERFLDTASPYFTELEGILLDSLAFTTWALTHDHAEDRFPFAYDNNEDRQTGLRTLEEIKLNEQAQGITAIGFVEEKVALYELIGGYSALAKHLRSLRENKDSYNRDAGEFPDFHKKTRLKVFRFESVVPFLNLSETSQLRIVEGLDEVAKILIDNEVYHVRNDYSHYRRILPDIARVEKAIDAVRRALSKLENLGFCRLLYEPSSVLTDEWGHQKKLFNGPRNYEHTFTRPTLYDWMGLPGLAETQYLVRSATFEDPNEVLRFTRRYHSEFSSYWENFPRRRRRSKQPVNDDQSLDHADDSKNTVN